MDGGGGGRWKEWSVLWRGSTIFADQWVRADLGCSDGPMIGAPRLWAEEGAARNLAFPQRVSIPDTGRTGNTGHCHPPTVPLSASQLQPWVATLESPEHPQSRLGHATIVMEDFIPPSSKIPRRSQCQPEPTECETTSENSARPDTPWMAPASGDGDRARFAISTRNPTKRMQNWEWPKPVEKGQLQVTRHLPAPPLADHHAHPHQTMTPSPASASDRSGCIHRSSRWCRPTTRKWAACSLFGSLAAPHAS